MRSIFLLTVLIVSGCQSIAIKRLEYSYTDCPYKLPQEWMDTVGISGTYTLHNYYGESIKVTKREYETKGLVQYNSSCVGRFKGCAESVGYNSYLLSYPKGVKSTEIHELCHAYCPSSIQSKSMGSHFGICN